MVEELGADSLVHGYFGSENTILAIRVPGTVKIKADMNLQLTCEPENLHLFDPESGNRLEVQKYLLRDQWKLRIKEGVMLLTVNHIELLGADTQVYGHFAEDKTLSTLRLSDIQHFKKNTILPLIVPPQKIHLFDKETGNRIGK